MLIFFPTGVDRPILRTPWVTRALLLANAAAYVLQHWILPDLRGASAGAIVKACSFTPAAASLAGALAHMFTHSGLLHLLGNLLYLYLVGSTVEDRIGHWRTAAGYVLGGLVALGVHAWSVSGTALAAVPMCGASGAIAALMGAFLVLMPWTDIKVYYAYMIMYRYSGSGTALVPALVFLGAYFFVSDVLWGLLTLKGAPTQVAHWAHVGGFAFGGLLAGCLYGFSALWTSEAEIRQRERRIARSLQRSVNAGAEEERERQAHARRKVRADIPLPPLPRAPGPMAPEPLSPFEKPRLRSIASLTEETAPPPAAHERPNLELLPPGLLDVGLEHTSSAPLPPSRTEARQGSTVVEPPDPGLARLGRELAEGELRHVLETPPPYGEREARAPLSPRSACTLLLLPAPHLAPEKIVRALRTVLGLPTDQVVARLRSQVGIVYASLPYDAGALVRARLRQMAVPTFLTENRPDEAPIEATLPQMLEMAPGAWHWRTGRGWMETRPSDLAFVAAGRVRVAPADPLPACMLDLHFLGLRARMRLMRAASPGSPCDGQAHPENDAVGGQPLVRVAEQLLAAAPHAQCTAAVQAWLAADGAPEALPLFKNVPVYDHYNRWHQLLWFAPPASA